MTAVAPRCDREKRGMRPCSDAELRFAFEFLTFLCAETFGLRGESGERNSCSMAALRCGVSASCLVSTTAMWLLFEWPSQHGRERSCEAAGREFL